jgi:hypothetical protein
MLSRPYLCASNTHDKIQSPQCRFLIARVAFFSLVARKEKALPKGRAFLYRDGGIDSIVTEAGPFDSRLQKGVKVHSIVTWRPRWKAVRSHRVSVRHQAAHYEEPDSRRYPAVEQEKSKKPGISDRCFSYRDGGI